ncbi:MAG TPA: TetR/AcrR family transcriptional regulator [Actinomycetota bacterium]
MSPTSADTRAQRKEKTRRALLNAAVAATIERNGEIPSIEALCGKAGYSRGAFYSQFRDRDQFVGEMLEWIITDILGNILESTTSGTSTIQEVMDRFVGMFTDRNWPDVQAGIAPVYLAVLRELQHGSSVRVRHATLMNGIVDRLEALIVAGQEAGRLRVDIRPRGAATICLLAAVGAVMWTDVALPSDVASAARTLESTLETARAAAG